MKKSSSSEPKPDASGEVEKPAVASRNATFADYLRVFSYATKWDFIVYAFAVLASLGSGITMPMMNIIFGQLVGQFTEYFRDTTDLSQESFRDLLRKQALLIMALFFGRWALSSINKFCFRMIGIRLSSAVRLHYFKSVFLQPIHAIDMMPAGGPATTISVMSNTLQLGISERLGSFLQANGTVWSALIIAMVWDWRLTLVTASLLLYLLAVLVICLPLILKSQAATVKAETEGNAIATEALAGIRLVMAAGAQVDIIARYNAKALDAMKKGQRMAPAVGVQSGLMYFGIFGAHGLAFWYGTKRYAEGKIDNPGAVIIVLMSIMMALMSMSNVVTPLTAVNNAIVAAGEFFNVIDAPKPRSGSLKLDTADHDILLEDVLFEYPSRPGATVLDRLNLRIPAGRNTALVGPSGSGKSTIVALLERWYSLESDAGVGSSQVKDEAHDPAEEATEHKNLTSVVTGQITVAGHNIEELDLGWWRAQIGLVQQEPFLFNETIFENVQNGLIGTAWADSPEDHKRSLVHQACLEANASEFIERLPKKYDTRVGDGGIKLSGGQRQRIAIARSIVKKPQIIILDEATSAIDVKSERLIQTALERVTKNRTTITIAHRLSTIQKADNIVVMKQGKVVEQGTHQMLMDMKSGSYRALVKAQEICLSEGNVSEEASSDHLVENAAEDHGKEMTDLEVQNAKHSTDEERPSAATKSEKIASSFTKLLYRQRDCWAYYICIVISAMCVAACTPLQAWLFAKSIEVFIAALGEMESKAQFWGLMWLSLAASIGLSWASQAWLCFHVQFRASASHKAQYFADMLFQKLAYFDQEQHSHGALSARISGDPKQVEELLGLNLASLFSGVFTVIGCLTTALVFNWRLGLIAGFITMPLMVVSGLWRYRHEAYFDQMNLDVFKESSQFATEAIGSIRTVAALGMETTLTGRYQELLRAHVRDAFRKARWTSILHGFADSVSQGCQALVFWYGGTMMLDGRISLEAFFVCFMSIIQGAEAASQVLCITPNAAQATKAADRIMELHHLPGERQHGDLHSPDDHRRNGGAKLELRHVSFKYPSRNTTVLNNVSLTIDQGQFAAFVGPSGCGKTTIISLLERFYDLTEGQGAIMYNDIDVNKFNLHAYRRSLSLVAQESVMFQGSFKDNILLGLPNPSTIPTSRIHQVCRDAFIHDFITSLPDGYNTNISQNGVNLSGGQKQRIAIARALIREPQLLLLDEATSALDSESEGLVQEAIEKARHGRTIVAVAHRLSTIQHADVIFFLDNGSVVESGTHGELLARRGPYWSMCQAQALAQ